MLAIALAVLAGLGAWALADDGEKQPLGLFTTLPVYWPEARDMAETLDGGGEQHWARTALEDRYRMVPLDTLEPTELARIERLLMAQPRPLAPAENVALDDWVRRGGNLLVFADPLLSAHSRFAIGDRRRPQDVVLLSPILARWGLDLRYDDAQPEGERTVDVSGHSVPVEYSGHLALRSGGVGSDCTIAAGGLVAHCDVERGRVTIFADAALLDAERTPEGDTLTAIAEAAFGD